MWLKFDGRLEGEDGLLAFSLVTWKILLGYCGGCRNGVRVRKRPGRLSWSDPNHYTLISWITGVWVVQAGSGLRREAPLLKQHQTS